MILLYISFALYYWLKATLGFCHHSNLGARTKPAHTWAYTKEVWRTKGRERWTTVNIFHYLPSNLSRQRWASFSSLWPLQTSTRTDQALLHGDILHGHGGIGSRTIHKCSQHQRFRTLDSWMRFPSILPRILFFSTIFQGRYTHHFAHHLQQIALKP